MRKTYCDGCGGEVGSYHAILHVHVEHYSSYERDAIAEDEFLPVDLCRACMASPVVLASLLTARRREPLGPDEARGPVHLPVPVDAGQVPG